MGSIYAAIAIKQPIAAAAARFAAPPVVAIVHQILRVIRPPTLHVRLRQAVVRVRLHPAHVPVPLPPVPAQARAVLLFLRRSPVADRHR